MIPRLKTNVAPKKGLTEAAVYGLEASLDMGIDQNKKQRKRVMFQRLSGLVYLLRSLQVLVQQDPLLSLATGTI